MLWNVCRAEREEAATNKGFKVRNGRKIRFWTDAWCYTSPFAGYFAGFWARTINKTSLAD